MVSAIDEVESNLERASRLVEEAARAGATLVLLPEFFSIGYSLSERAWDFAEPEGGRTEAWLCDTASRLGVYVGGCYLLASGEDFYIVFALATPAGEIAGRVPKQKPASFEAYLIRGQVSRHIIETPLGRIGVGICYENAFRFLAEAMIAGDADIMLMPFSAPTPKATWFFPRKSVDAYLASYRHGASRYARLLGIPAIQVNQCGDWHSDLPSFFPPQESKFHGQSEIADNTGAVVAQLADQQSIIVADVTLDPARKICKLPDGVSRAGHWLLPLPHFFKIFPIIEALGRRWYDNSPRRREKARAVLANAGVLLNITLQNYDNLFSAFY
jgi:N-carbamoylputrescine amidase